MSALARLRYACQTYSWQMSIETYRGRVDHMTSVAARAGFDAFEAELVMLGDDWSDAGLSASLERSSIELAALVLVERWTAAVETPEERADADRLIAAVAAHPGAKLVLVPYPGADRSDLADRQRDTMACMAAVAERAADAGVSSTFHPNSPAGSLFRTADDYAVMADLLPPGIGYTPDLGHIAKGGMDPLSVVREWRDRVDHLHIKDVAADGTWARTGEGIVDVRGVLEYLESTGYDGWVVFEDESPDAERDPDAATLANGDYIKGLTA